MLVTLYEIGEGSFHLIATNDFLAKAENERFTAAGSRCRQNLKFENFPRHRLADTPHQKNVSKCVLHQYFF